MASLKTIIDSFLLTYRSKTVKEGGVSDLDYLKDLLPRLNITKKSGSSAETDFYAREAIQMPLFNGEIENNLSKVILYDPKQSDADRSYHLMDLSFSHTRRKGIDSFNISFSWLESSETDAYNQCKINLEGTLKRH
jgi:hypothetical protein